MDHPSESARLAYVHPMASFAFHTTHVLPISTMEIPSMHVDHAQAHSRDMWLRLSKWTMAPHVCGSGRRRGPAEPFHSREGSI